MSMPAERLPESRDLQDLLQGIADAPPIPVTGIRDDSRRVRPGDLFIACRGASHHGLDFAAQVIAAGAAAIAWDRSTGDARQASGNVPFVAVDDLAARRGDIANRWYGQPSADVDVVGVTGTNGKTTVAWLASRALNRLGCTAGYVGTLGAGVGDIEATSGLTTPPCLELHATLAGFRDADARAAAIEVSSHGLSQRRVAGIAFDAAVLTNLSRDHIDYHGDMQAYAESKATLFTEYDCRHRIVGLDSDFGRELADRLGQDVIVTSGRGDRDARGRRFVFARSAEATPSGSRVTVDSSWGSGELRVSLPGEFNVANALQVVAILLARGVNFGDAADVLANLEAPPGRLQLVNRRDEPGPQVYVDYAHTPGALEAVLQALRPHARGRIWCVFGCGGDRDRGKRPQMGRVVSRLADRAVITSDNPRSEDPGSIIAEIQAGITTDAFVIEDRAAAIARTIAKAREQDTVLIAGKGHEDYQIIGDARLDFSDYQHARASLDARRATGSGA